MTSDIKFIATIGAIKTYSKDQVPDVRELDENGVEVRIPKKDKDGNVLLKKNGEPQTMPKIKKRGHGSLLQRIQHNHVKEMTIHDLANEIRQHHSFRASEIDPKLLKGGAYTVTDSLFKSFQLLAVDVDHGNMSLDDLKALLNKQSLNNYALIYPTLSSNDVEKRWRVVFVLDKPSTSEEYFEKLHAYLIYCLFEPYAVDLKTHKVDASCKNTSRLFFTSKNGEITEEYNRTISFDCLLEKALERNYVEIINGWASKYHEFNEKKSVRKFKKKDTLIQIPDTQVFDFSDLMISQEMLKDIKEKEFEYFKALQEVQAQNVDINASVKIKVTGKDGVSREILVSQAKSEMSQSLGINRHYLTDALEQQIEDALIQYSYEVDTMWIDANEAIEFINKLDLSVLLGVELKEYIACPFHAENKHDSAAIFQTTSGITLFNCFSCGTQHTTFHFLHELYYAKYGDNYYQTIQRVLRIMDLELGSEYQKAAKENINFSTDLLTKMVQKDSEFTTMLTERNLLGLLDRMYSLASVTCPVTPLTADEKKMKSATIFASKEHIRKDCVAFQVENNKSIKSIHKNINLLVKYGLLNKLTDEEITEEFLEVALKRREKMLRKFNEKKKNTDKEATVRRTEYYAIPCLSKKVINTALTLMKNDEKTGMGTKKNMNLRTQTLASEQKAKETFVQDEAKFSKEETKFIKDAKKYIPVLLDTVGYVSEKNIVPYIDVSRSVIKSVRKKEKIAKELTSAICASFNLTKLPVTKDVKKSIKLYEDYHWKECIYVKE